MGEPVYAVAIDARRDQVYLEAFRGGRSIIPAQALPAAAAGAALQDFTSLRLAGSGASLLAVGLPQAVVVHTETPDPVIVARLAATAQPLPMRPIYLRAPDAKLPI